MVNGRGASLVESEPSRPAGRNGPETTLRRLEAELTEARAALAVARDAAQLAERREWNVVGMLQHRVKNVLAVVRSISARTLELSDSIDSYGTHFFGRLDALARAQGVLVRASAGVDLEDLIRDELAASATHEGEQVTISGPRVLLKDRAVEVLAMAFHELTMNAVKFGALASQTGKLAVEWHEAGSPEGPRLVLSWRESGVPVLDSKPSRAGFGRDLLESGVPYDLSAVTKLAFAPGGVQWYAMLPLGERITIADEREDQIAHEAE